VVLVHGAMDRSASFGRTVRVLSDLCTIRYDRRGYGHSTEVGVGTLDQHVDDLIEVIDGARGDAPADDRAVVVGHSIGGVIALVAAARHPERITSVAAWEAPMPWADWWPTSTAATAAMQGPPGAGTGGAENGAAVAGSGSAGDAAERFMRRMIGDDRWARLPSTTRAARRAEGEALLADLRSLRWPTAPYAAASIVPPVLAGCGTVSVSYHQRAAHELADAAPSGELVTIDGAAHGAHLSHPREFAGFVRRAVERAAERRRAPGSLSGP